MAAEQETPTELGIPLPLVPIENLAEIPKDQTNWHHHFHPRTNPALIEEGGSVIRTARLQKSLKFGNHEQYHQYYTGPPLPDTSEERFRIAVLARAGYVPERGILMRGRDETPREVVLSRYQRHLLTYEGQLKPGSAGDTREFIGKFILAQDLSDIKISLIDELLHSKDTGRKQFLGYWMLSQAIERAVLPIADDYRRAWADKKIPTTLPVKPHSFLSITLGRSVERQRLIRRLKTQLAA